MNIIHIASKPLIHLSIETKEGLIFKTSLKSSKGFTCSFSTENQENLTILSWLEAYSKKTSFVLTPSLFDWGFLTASQRNFLPVLGQIPFGKTLSYGELGKIMGCHPKGIGQLCKHNPFPLFYPCHRVLGANQALGGFNYGPEPKISLLDFENVKFLLKK